MNQPDTADQVPPGVPSEVADVPAIEVVNLSHRFKTHLAVDGASFTVRSGSIHGFVGPNGAGKTTTLKILATLLPQTRGSVRVFGKDVKTDTRAVRRRIGYMPDHFAMYPKMRVREYLDFFAAAYGQTAVERRTTVRDVLTLTDMDGRAHDLIKSLSRGMQQRVSLARVLVHDPSLLLLDEPASGLDPRARIELMAILRELRDLGKTVFISSHILSELATLCDSVTIIDRGKIKYSGQVEALLTRAEEGRSCFVLTLAEPTPAVVPAWRQTAGVHEVLADPADERAITVTVETGIVRPADLLQIALAQGGDVVEFHKSRRHLDQVFMDLTEPGVGR